MINHPENIDFGFPVDQGEQDIETNSPCQEEIIKQEYKSQQKNYTDNPESKR